MAFSPPLVNDLFLDGKFIKISRNPKLDFLKFSTPNYPFYQLSSNQSSNRLIKKLALSEPVDIRTYRRLGRLGTVYKGLDSYIYTHYGSNLVDVADLQFFEEFKQITNTTPTTIKRIDFAIDLFGIDLIELIKNSMIHSKRQLTTQFLSYDYINGSRIYKGDPSFNRNIQTFYAGKVNSSVSICIYKKHLQLNVTGPITRIEIRFKGPRANQYYNEFFYNSTPLGLNRVLGNLFDYYIAFKIPNSSKSSRLSRHKNMSWWNEFLIYLKS